MAGHAFSTFAALVAVVFFALAVTSCASSEHHVAQADESPAHAYKGNGVGEFHDAHIGGDALRERLPGE